MIAVRGLAHRYGAAEALRLAEWRVAQGERWLVLGPSGSGKTTLLHILAGLVRPSEGEVEVAGESLRKLAGDGSIAGAARRWASCCRRCTWCRHLQRARQPAPRAIPRAPAAGRRPHRRHARRARRRRQGDAPSAASSRRASSSAWRSRAPWSTARSCCSPTNRPRTSTTRPRRSRSTCSPSRRRATARRWWWRRTMRASKAKFRERLELPEPRLALGELPARAAAAHRAQPDPARARRGDDRAAAPGGRAARGAHAARRARHRSRGRRQGQPDAAHPLGHLPSGCADRQHPARRRAGAGERTLREEGDPLALGDSWKGYRIVGAGHEYPSHYGATLQPGGCGRSRWKPCSAPKWRQRTGAGVGAKFAGAHGIGGEGDEHEEAPYTVVGDLVKRRIRCSIGWC